MSVYIETRNEYKISWYLRGKRYSRTVYADGVTEAIDKVVLASVRRKLRSMAVAEWIANGCKEEDIIPGVYTVRVS